MSVHGLSVVPYAKGYRPSVCPTMLKIHDDEKTKVAMWSRLPTNISKSLP